MVMVPTDFARFITTTKALVEAGSITQDRIDDAVTRILRVKFEMGLFEEPMPAAGNVDAVGADAARALARTAVARFRRPAQDEPGHPADRRLGHDGPAGGRGRR